MEKKKISYNDGKNLLQTPRLRTVANHLIAILNKIIEDEQIDANLRVEITTLLPCLCECFFLFL
jgi:hypothetical protein